MIIFRSIHVEKIALFHSFLWQIFHFMYNTFFFVHSPIYGHLRLSHVFATVHCATINTVVHVSFLTGVFILTGYMTTNGVAGSYGNCLFFFKLHTGEGGGREVQREVIYVYLWLIFAEVCQKTTKFCKTSILQLQIN